MGAKRCPTGVYMNAWYSFVSMGKYSYFVWSAYAIAGIILTANIVLARFQRKHIFKKLRLRLRTKL